MKHALWIILLMFGFSIQAYEEENNETLSITESSKDLYAYFGSTNESLYKDLLAIHVAANKNVSQTNLKELCTLIDQGATTAPATMIKAALEEAVHVLHPQKMFFQQKSLKD